MTGEERKGPESMTGNPELRILKSIRRIIRAVDLQSRRLASQHNVTGPQFACLSAVVERGPITAALLAGIVHLSPSTLVGIIDRLEKKGLLTRCRDEADRRRVLLSASEAGRELAGQVSSLQVTFSTALANLPESEQAALAGAVERIVNLMEVQHLDAAPILETGPIDRPGA